MGNKEAVNERLAIRNARLVSALTEGYDGDQADLLIEDGRITGLFPVGHDFGSCDEIDAAGRTVLPGMLDLHTHLHFTKMDDLFSMSRKQNDVLLDCVDYAAELLRQGFTTIRDCGQSALYGYGGTGWRGTWAFPRTTHSFLWLCVSAYRSR